MLNGPTFNAINSWEVDWRCLIAPLKCLKFNILEWKVYFTSVDTVLIGFADWKKIICLILDINEWFSNGRKWNANPIHNLNLNLKNYCILITVTFFSLRRDNLRVKEEEDERRRLASYW